jgi:DNA end-binding protein Ku
MAAPRPYWKGFLKLSLVSCPVALYPATSASERIAFRQINKKTGNRLRQQLVDEVTRQPVETADKGRGYEVDKGQYLPIEDDELDAIEIESTHTIAIDKFVPRAQIDLRYFDSPYYITPNDDVGEEAFSVIREAMKSEGMVGLGRVVLSKRERVIALEARGKGLIGTTLRYPYEVRSDAEYFEPIKPVKVDREMLDLAKHLIETKAGDFNPAEMTDHYETALVDLLKQKQKGFVPKPSRVANARPNVINLMDALRRSVKDNAAKPKKRGKAA